MKTFSYYAARAHVGMTGGDRTAHVGYFGPLCGRAFARIAPQVMAEIGGADAAMIRMDACLWLAGATPGIHPQPGPMPPACVVVRADQFDVWTRYAAAAAEAGFRRIVFLDSQLELAQEWLLRQSARQSMRRGALPLS